MTPLRPTDSPDEHALLRHGVCAWRLATDPRGAPSAAAACWALSGAATDALQDAAAFPLLNRSHRPTLGAPTLLAAGAPPPPGLTDGAEFLLAFFADPEGPALEVTRAGAARRLDPEAGVVALIWCADPRVSWRLDAAASRGSAALIAVSLPRFDAGRIAAPSAGPRAAIRLEMFG